MPGRMMPDPFGSMGNMVNQYRLFRKNPMKLLSKRIRGIPQGMDDPNQIIQHMMNTGQMSQEQYNYYNQMVQHIQGNQQFGEMMNGGNPQMMNGVNPQMMNGVNPQMMSGNPQMMGGGNPRK